jgi:hypothetical protein
MTDGFDALFGAGRGADRDGDPAVGAAEVWWRSLGVPDGLMADFLDRALMAGHTSVSLTLSDDCSWEADGAGGRAPTVATGEDSTGAEWLLTWAPQTHAVDHPAPCCWTWRLDSPTDEPTRPRG